MPGFVVTMGQIVLCTHGGTATPVEPNPRVMIMGQPVITQVSPMLVAGCLLEPDPCVSANFVTGALRVTAMGQPLVLQDSLAFAEENGSPLMIMPGQLRVRGI